MRQLNKHNRKRNHHRKVFMLTRNEGSSNNDQLATFSFIRFSMADFMLRSLIHLDLNFVHDDSYGSVFILLHVDASIIC